MSEGVITALIAAGSAAAGYLASYFTARRTEQRQVNQAELNYMVRLQEMLQDSAKQLTEAQEAHTQQIIALERGKYFAEEALKQANAEHKRIVQSLVVESNDQDAEIRLYVAESELYQKEIDRLNGVLTDLGVPVVPFNLPHRGKRTD